MEIKSNPLKRMLANAFGLNIAPNNLLEAPPINNKTEGNTELLQIDEDLKTRAGRRLLAEEINKQKNLEDVIQRADDILQSEAYDNKQDVLQEKTDQGWVDDCLDGAGKAYDDDLKGYWAKLLAGEIINPGKYSLRAIDLMKKMSKKDAERIRKMCQYVMYSPGMNDAFILQYDSEPYSFDDIRFLMELRLLDSQSFMVKKYAFKQESGQMSFYHGDIGFIINVKKSKYDLSIYAFTELGIEILSIIDDIPANVENFKLFAEYMLNVKKEPMEFMCGKISIINGAPMLSKNSLLYELSQLKKEDDE